VADGHHARTDGLTSLAVLVGAGGVAVGWHWADPVVGLVITVAILAVLRTAARDVLRRLMDGVEPTLVEQAEATLAAVPGVTAVRGVRMRWIGHRIHAEAELDVHPDATLVEAHALAHRAEDELVRTTTRLTSAVVHAYPASDAVAAGTRERHGEARA
jgi:cation diffusion facilitator family transporter